MHGNRVRRNETGSATPNTRFRLTIRFASRPLTTVLPSILGMQTHRYRSDSFDIDI